MVLSILWTLFTLALVAWWMIFTMQQLNRLQSGQLSDPTVYLQQEKMIKAEGGVLLMLLGLGGVGLVLALWQLQRQHERVRDFFSVFTHEIKTSLARLILKSDIMAEENPESHAFQQFKEETVFLQTQLENALWVAKGFGTLFWEKVEWSKLIRDFEWSWPSLQWHYEGAPFDVRMDRRAFQMVLRNLVQNSISHGHATKITFRAVRNESQWTLWVEDNGGGFAGDHTLLGLSMERAMPSSGTGIGLWVVVQGVLQLGGQVSFYSPDKGGFGVRLNLPMGQML